MFLYYNLQHSALLGMETWWEIFTLFIHVSHFLQFSSPISIIISFSPSTPFLVSLWFPKIHNIYRGVQVILARYSYLRLQITYEKNSSSPHLCGEKFPTIEAQMRQSWRDPRKQVEIVTPKPYISFLHHLIRYRIRIYMCRK